MNIIILYRNDMFIYDSRLKPIRACALMWGISRTLRKNPIIYKCAKDIEGVNRGENKEDMKRP